MRRQFINVTLLGFSSYGPDLHRAVMGVVVEVTLSCRRTMAPYRLA